MNIAGILIIALGLSMDVFAVAIYKGLKLAKADLRSALIVGLYFGTFQVIMMSAGYLAAASFAGGISSFDWIAFVLLSLLGIRMIVGSLRGGSEGRERSGSLRPEYMIPLTFVISVDALAVGVSFALLGVDIFPAVAVIGAIAFAAAIIGVRIGRRFGKRIGSGAELLGGVILVLIGLVILLEGRGIIGF